MKFKYQHSITKMEEVIRKQKVEIRSPRDLFEYVFEILQNLVRFSYSKYLYSYIATLRLWILIHVTIKKNIHITFFYI